MGRSWNIWEQCLAAAAAGLWAAGFLAADGPATAPASFGPIAITALSLAWAASAFLARRLPLPAAALCGAVQAAAVLLGLSMENPAPLAAALLSAYACGRFVADAAGLLGLPLLLAALALPAAGTQAGDALFGSVLYGMAFAYGRLVRRRFTASMQAALAESRLAAADPQQAAEAQAATERERTTADVLAVVGTAMDSMHRAALRAAKTLAPADIQRITADGAAAVGQLKMLLVALRGGAAAPLPVPALGEAAGAAHAKAGGRRRATSGAASLAGWLAPTAVVLALLASEWPFLPPGPAVTGAALGIFTAALLLVRRRSPALACLASAGLLGAGGLAGIPLPQGLGLAAACVVLTWAALADGRLAVLLAWCVFAAALLLVLAAQAPQNVPINLGIVGFTGFAAHAWRTHGRAERAALGRSEVLALRFAADVDAVLAAERLELARTVHDLASHALGGMVMQAGAASVLAQGDPAEARRALALVTEIGSSARAGLATLAAGSGDAGQWFGGQEHGSPETLEQALTRAHTAGLVVEVARADTTPPHQAVLVHRIVREALSNAIRHAPGSTVRISVCAGPTGCTVTVENGRSTAPSPGPGAGFGLRGLRELLHARGGSLDAGPTAGPAPAAVTSPAPAAGAARTRGSSPASGFVVRAVLPALPQAVPGPRKAAPWGP
jgi:signal transduction histidine kinase